nr:DapH/DapD/GlmU-related protein [Rhodococcus sp. NBC_00297]
MSENHKFERRDLPIREQGETRQCVDIGDDVWVGSNVTILAGVKVGNGAIVAAGAVVNKDVAPFTIVGGVPAKQIGIRPESRNG